MCELDDVRSDDELCTALAAGMPGNDPLTELLAAWIAEVTAGPPPVERVSSDRQPHRR